MKRGIFFLLIGIVLVCADIISCSGASSNTEGTTGGTEGGDSGSEEDGSGPGDPGTPGDRTIPNYMVGNTDPDAILPLMSITLPSVGEATVDPSFGVTFYRISDTSSSGGFGTQIYSQLQAFSSDNQYILLVESENYIVRRFSDFTQVSGLDTSSWNAPRWHPSDAHTLVYFDSNEDETLRVMFTNVDTLQTSTYYTFPSSYLRIRGNQSFDELSEDGVWLGGMMTRSDGANVIFSLNLESQTLGALIPLPDLYASSCQPDPTWGELEPDWVGVSPLGRYIMVQWQRDGTSRCSGLESYDIQSGAFAGRVYDGHQHGDLGIMPDGDTEFFMTFELAAPPPDNDRPALGLRLLPGNSTVAEPEFLQVLDWGNAEHISCRGPWGICLITAGSDSGNGWNPFEGELFLQYTDGSVRRLIHHRSSSCGYWVQPRASISRDGNFVIFASDWGMQSGQGSCDSLTDGQGDPFLIDLRN